MTTYPIAIPTSPAFQKVVITPQFATSVTQSPFSFSSQSYDFGGMMWQAQCTLPPMNRAQAAAWKAFLLLLHGNAGTFTMGKVVDATPQGTATAATANGDCPALSNSIVVNGMGSGKTLLAGDYFGFNNRIYMVTANVTSDGSGNATINFEPASRDDIPTASPLVLSNPQGTWRMAASNTGWTDDETLTTGLTFACIESL